MLIYCIPEMITLDYRLGGLLFCANQIKDLEFLYVPSLDFCPHINHIACKTVRVLCYIECDRENFNSSKCHSRLCYAYVRTSVLLQSGHYILKMMYNE